MADRDLKKWIKLGDIDVCSQLLCNAESWIALISSPCWSGFETQDSGNVGILINQSCNRELGPLKMPS